MNNACPDCGAMYSVTDADIGRRILCKRCKTALIVAESGLVRDGTSPAPQAAVPAPTPLPPPASSTRTPKPPAMEEPELEPEAVVEGPGRHDRFEQFAQSGLVNRLRGMIDGPLLIYGLGLAIFIYYSHSSRIDDANVAWRQANILEAKTDEAIIDRDLENRKDTKESDKEARRKEKDKFTTEQLPKLQDRATFAEISASKAKWWNSYGHLLGTLLLSIGALGLLITEGTQTRRVVGAATLILVIMMMTGGGGFVLQVGK